MKGLIEMLNLSFVVGDHYSRDHNRRKHITDNVVKEDMSKNIYYETGMSEREFYRLHFQEAYEAYKEKQRQTGHGNRVKDWPEEYYDFIREKQLKGEEQKKRLKADNAHYKDIHKADMYQRTVKEIIIQFGNTEELSKLSDGEKIDMQEKMTAALKAYLKDFEKNNPGFKVLDWVIHRDEVGGVPHAHLDIVPVVECSRGQRVQNSLNGAYKMMGLEDDIKKDKGYQPPAGDKKEPFMTAQMKWQRRERDRLLEIAKEYDFEATYKKGNRGQHLDVRDFKAKMEREKSEEHERQLENMEDSAVAEIEKFKQDIDVMKNELWKEAQTLQTDGKRAYDYPEAKLHRGCRIVPEDELETIIQKGWYSTSGLKDKADKMFEKISKLPIISHILRKNEQLQQENHRLRQRVAKLEQKNKEQAQILEIADNLRDKSGRSLLDIVREKANNVLHKQKSRDDDFER